MQKINWARVFLAGIVAGGGEVESEGALSRAA